MYSQGGVCVDQGDRLAAFICSLSFAVCLKSPWRERSQLPQSTCSQGRCCAILPCGAETHKLISETFHKVFTKSIFQQLNYFLSSQSIMSHHSKALHIKLFSCCSLRQLLGIKIALGQNLQKQLKAWCLGDFCNYELIMFGACKDSCLWHQWRRAVCGDKDRNISLLDCGPNSNFELLFVSLLSLNLSHCVLCASWISFWPGEWRLGQVNSWQSYLPDQACSERQEAVG